MVPEDYFEFMASSSFKKKQNNDGDLGNKDVKTMYAAKG